MTAEYTVSPSVAAMSCPVRSPKPAAFGERRPADLQRDVGAPVVHRINREVERREGGFDAYFVDHAAGVYPQQFFPRLNIVLTVRRTGETRSINGPVPYMVETAVNLLAERLRTADGFAYPLRACREAVVNALQHRDYSPEGRGSQVRIDLFDDRLEILNPGGFFRAAVYNRQIHGLAALRNANLTRILECTPCPDADGRPGTVLEPGTQGLLLIDEALEAAGRPRAVVHDWVSAVSLVFFREERIVHWTDFEYDLTTALSERDSIALTEIVRCSGLSRSTVLAKLRRMIDAGLIERTEPLHSPRQRYRLSS